MQRLYTGEQIEGLNLPGFRSEAGLAEFTQPDTDWQPVLSLSIYSESPDNPEQIEVLTGIRSNDTPTHNNVVSTPTGRFPKTFEQPLLEDKADYLFDTPTVEFDELHAGTYHTLAAFSPNRQSLPDRDEPLTYLAHEILARKLGLADQLQAKRGMDALGTISLSRAITGFSYAAFDERTQEPLWEPLIMYAASIFLNRRDVIPAQTSAYRSLGWTNLQSFLDGFTRKESAKLVPDIEPSDEAMVCVRGLCLSSTASVTESPVFRGHLGLPATDKPLLDAQAA